MQLEPNFVVKFVHDTIKPIQSLLQWYAMEEAASQVEKPSDPSATPKPIQEQAAEAERAKKEQAQRRRVWLRSLQCIERAFSDLQTMASCETSDKKKWEKASWPAMVAPLIEKLRKSHGFPFEWLPAARDFSGRCDSDLIRHALASMNFFANHFSNRLLSVALREETQGKHQVKLTYVFETALELGAEFKQIKPFTVLSKESTTIEHNTALILYVVERILRLHGGALNVQCEGRRAILELSCPLVAA